MNRTRQKTSIKSYILLLSLGFILFLILCGKQIPEISLRIINTVNTSYDSLVLLIRSEQVPFVAETQKLISPLKSDSRRTGDILRILNPEAPTLLNPHLSSALKDWEACRLTYEPLASADKDGNLIPILAAEIPTLKNGGVALDGKSVTWKLKKGIKWSDGKPFTADDVLFTYQFDTNPEVQAFYAANYELVENLKVIDPYTIKINFKDVTPIWTLFFVGTGGVILPRHIFEPYNGPNAHEAPANTFPVGTGPYRVVSPGIKPQEVLLLGTQLVETNKIVFEPNPYFREPGRPFFSRVEYRGGGTSKEAARLVLQTGEIDYAYGLQQLSPDELAELETGGTGRLDINFSSTCERILLNRTDPDRKTEEGEGSSLRFPHPFFSDKKVRQAFAHAIDRDTIAKLYGGRPTTNNLVAPPQYDLPKSFYEFNLEKAKRLLEEAGWIDRNNNGIRDKDGKEMKVRFQSLIGKAPQQTQQVVKQALESIGIEVELKMVDASLMFKPGHPDRNRHFNADIQMFGMTSDYFDPGPYMQLWTCTQIPQKANNWSGLNIERWCNPEYDTLYQQSTTEIDPEKRRELIIRMDDMLIEDIVMIPLVHIAVVQGVSRTVEGVEFTPWDAKVWNIKDWRRVSP